MHAIRPIREGRVANYPLTEALAREALDMALGGQSFSRPRVLLCVPQGIDEAERRALQDSVRAAGAREVQLLPKSIAAAVGSELPIHEATASMVIDMGGGTTEVCVMSLGGVVDLTTIRVGGHTLDAAITGWIRERHGLMVGERITEELKVNVGTAIQTPRPRSTRIRGRDMNSAVPRETEILSTDLLAAVQPALSSIVEGIRQMMNRLSPDLAGDLSQQGVVLSGGASMLRGMEAFLRQQTGTPMVLAQDPQRATVTGAGWLLEERTHLERVLL
jgi:rod shape-determining protein MreB